MKRRTKALAGALASAVSPFWTHSLCAQYLNVPLVLSTRYNINIHSPTPLQIIQLIYLVAAVCFILSLKFLSSQKQARLGSTIGILGMAIAVVVTFFPQDFTPRKPVIATILLCAVISGIIALKISMTAMPQLVAGFHSFVGLAAVFIAYATVLAPENFSKGIARRLPMNALIGISVGVSIGALTFSGSIIAFLKLQGLLKSSPLKFQSAIYMPITSNNIGYSSNIVYLFREYIFI